MFGAEQVYRHHFDEHDEGHMTQEGRLASISCDRYTVMTLLIGRRLLFSENMRLGDRR